MNQEFVKKYGVWVAGGALVLYLAYRNLRGPARQSLIGSAPGAAGVSAEQSRLELERLRAAGSLDLERLRIQAAEEAARRKAELDRYNLEQQVAARNRALDAAQRGQTFGLIGQILQSLSKLLGGSQSSSKGGSSGGSGGTGGGGGFPGTPPIAGRTQPQLPPSYSIPIPSIDTLGTYDAQYPTPPEYIPLRIDDWGEAPMFQASGLDLDTGATFFDQFGGDWDYSSGFFTGQDFGGFDLFSSLPEASEIPEGQTSVTPEEYAASEGYIIEGTDFDYGYGY